MSIKAPKPGAFLFIQPEAEIMFGQQTQHQFNSQTSAHMQQACFMQSANRPCTGNFSTARFLSIHRESAFSF
jgi:hypothetical protein